MSVPMCSFRYDAQDRGHGCGDDGLYYQLIEPRGRFLTFCDTDCLQSHLNRQREHFEQELRAEQDDLRQRNLRGEL